VILPDSTPAVARSLEAAQNYACRLGATEIQPLHVLRGLVDEEEGRAALLLARVGVSPAVLKQALAEDDCDVPRPPNISPPSLSQSSQEILQAARERARDLGEYTVASDHLLLAVLLRDDAIREKLLPLGLDLIRLESEGALRGAPTLRLEEPLVLNEATEQIDPARILDASANRAREALRVIEDYCRFTLDDRYLSGQLKQLRHDLTETLAALPSNLLLEARDTLGDVGTSLSTEAEQKRLSLQAVVQANLKRLQEALRSLEEYGKLWSPDLGTALERLRYRSYTLDRALVLGGTARQRLAEARLYVLVTGSLCRAALDWTIQEAAAGGAQIIQLREKNLRDRELMERARQVRHWTRKARVLFIMNDRPDLARLAEADGVHLGQEELSVKDARRILGPDALIGVSTHALEQVRQAVLDGANYIGVGPAFASETKQFGEIAGLEFVRQATAETSLPAFVIGGVNLGTLAAAVAAGARRVAVSQAICQAEYPRSVAAEMRRILDQTPTLPTPANPRECASAGPSLPGAGSER
jgi:thiamine-phosphate pyrophosphorylase